MNIERQHALATLLAQLRRDHRQQSGFAASLIPPTASAAYHVASLVSEMLQWPVGGRKIAALKDGIQKVMRSDRPIYGRVYRQFIFQSPCALPFSTLCSPLLEAEFVAHLGSDLPPRERPYAISDVADAVASLHPGLEIGECRFAYDSKFPPLTAILADGAGSGHLIVGPPIADWRGEHLAHQRVTVLRDGTIRRQGTAVESIDHPMVALAWLANELSSQGIGLKASEWISTGTVTGIITAKKGEAFEADFGACGGVSVTCI